MNKNNRNKIAMFLGLGLSIAVSYTACTPGFKNNAKDALESAGVDQASTGTPSDGSGIDPVTGQPTVDSKLPSSSVPTIDGIVARIRNGLEGRVNPLAGNFLASLNVVKANMPKVPNPLQASGYDQAQLAIYGACSDLTTGNTPQMQSVYNVTANGTVTANQNSLIAAGIRMLDQHTGGLASTGSMSADVRKIFSDLVTKSAATTGITSRIAFMTVCIAANTTGVLMLGN